MRRACWTPRALPAHQAALFKSPASDSTLRRALSAIDDKALTRIAKARARVRRHVWNPIALRPGGFPWLSVTGKRLTGWIVIDIDATIITSASRKAGAAVTFKRTFGFHPLAAWCQNTQECLAMLLREGNAGANTVTDHLRVLADALARSPTPRPPRSSSGSTAPWLPTTSWTTSKSSTPPAAPCATWSAGS
ncbi:transposase [Streptacidiphilus sp. EB129]|uniref:transposase n=1 Tax=Streptacidiphilus sp. EB129 TaxID=3156262 RepID=UPI0035119E70